MFISIIQYLLLHNVHVINNVFEDKLDNVWINAINEAITLKAMIIDLRHFMLHLNEISDLIKQINS